MKIKYIKGNLFKLLPLAKNIICPHIVNDCKLWGSGFVVPLGNYFPKSKKEYLEQESIILGTCQFVQVLDNLIIANMVGQHGIMSKNNLHPIKYEELKKSMILVKEKALSIPDCEIHCPKFGSQRAGGEWSKIEKLIDEIWVNQNIEVTVYYLN
jgi:hypothetical protein